MKVPPPPATRDTAKVVGIGLLFVAGIQLVARLLAANDVGAAAVQAALAEWGAGRLGIAWSDPMAPPPGGGAIARRAASGAAFGFAAGALAVVALLLGHGGRLERGGGPVVSQLLVGLLVSTLAAVRDELVLRGFVLRALNGWPTPVVALLVCGLAGGAAALGGPDATAMNVAVAGVGGVAFGALWLRDRGAWMPVAAHAAWSFSTGSVLRGGLLDVRFAAGFWGGGDAQMPGSGAALAVGALLAAIATWWAIRPLRARGAS